jgi:hypothetical protein
MPIGCSACISWQHEITSLPQRTNHKTADKRRAVLERYAAVETGAAPHRFEHLKHRLHSQAILGKRTS